MSLESLKLLLCARRLSQSDLARSANITRQTVSRWFALSRGSQLESLNIESKTLLALTENLKLNASDLLTSTKILEKNELQTALLWDHLYGSLEEFAVALARQELRAVARLVQVYGMFASAKIVGQLVWKKFDRYSKYIHPARRSECEKICKLHQSLNLA